MATKKKSYAEQVADAYNAQADEYKATGQTLAEGMTAAGQKQIEDLEAANQARIDADNEAQRLYRQRMDEGYTNFADIIAAGDRRLAQDQAQDAAQYEADKKAARWTGAAELASSIANLVAVGGYNAVSQQYKSYSQDWMKKADEDARYRRARIDNLRDRQNQMQQRLLQLKMGDAGQALAMANRRTDAAYQYQTALAQQRYANAVNPLNTQAQYAEKAAAARTQGATQSANVGLHERQLAQSAAQHAAQLEETKRYHNKQLEIQAAKAARGTGSGSGSKTTGLSLKVKLDGKDVTLNMDEKSYQEALKRGRPDLKKDVLAMAKSQYGIDNWDDLVSGAESKKVKDGEGKKVRNPLYGSELSKIAGILNRDAATYDEDDWAAIASFAEGNYDSTDNFNTHLFQVSRGAYPWATRGEEEESAKAEEKAPTSEANPESGEYNFEDKSQTEQTGMPTVPNKENDVDRKVRKYFP